MGFCSRLTLLLFAAVASHGQLTAPYNGVDKTEYRGLAATGSTTITTSTVHVVAVVLINRASAEKTVSVYDRSTDCGSAACNLVPPSIPIAAKTQYVIALPFSRANGIVIVAPDSTSIEYKITVVP